MFGGGQLAAYIFLQRPGLAQKSWRDLATVITDENREQFSNVMQDFKENCFKKCQKN
jgi:hypothetical protein